jgi:hypothetical protein
VYDAVSRTRFARVLSVMAILGGLIAFSLTPAGATHRSRTIRGVIGIDVEAVTVNPPRGGDWGDTATIPGGARTRLSDREVTVAGGADSDEHPCNGTFLNPTAPRDKVCIYIANSDNAANIEGVSISPGPRGVRWGFKIVWDQPNVGEDSFVDATWAYRKPLRH